MSLADNLFQKAFELHKNGLITDALTLYEEVLALQETHTLACELVAFAYVQLKRFASAIVFFDKLIRINPLSETTHFNRGCVLSELGRFEDAADSYAKATAIKPPYFDAHFNHGNVLFNIKRFEQAIASYDQAIAIKPDHASVWNNRGNALKELKCFEQAIASYDQAIAIKPDHVSAWNNRGNALRELKCFERAIASYDQAIVIKPDAHIYFNCGIAWAEIRRFEQAIANYEKAIAIKPDAHIYCNCGIAWAELRRFDVAIANYKKAIELDASHADSYFNLANVFIKIGYKNGAIASYKKAISLKPDHAAAIGNYASVLDSILEFDLEMIKYYEGLIKNSSHSDFLQGRIAHIRSYQCNWDGWDEAVAQLSAGVLSDVSVCQPFPMLSLVDDPAIHLKAAQHFAKKTVYGGSLPPLSALPTTQNRPIRLAYFSCDFQNHPVSFLTAGLFEKHDRTRFEVTAVSIGPGANDEMRQRLKKTFDRFFDAQCFSDAEVAAQCRDWGIDIAIDLSGYTGYMRSGIFAERCAPIQISWLGYPGTLGADFMDYIIADSVVVEPIDFQYFSEKIIRLPGSFQPHDHQRRFPEKKLTRADCGLPADAFVFCCFNNTYKITPSTFQSWMRILKQTPNSVLWLVEGRSGAKENLSKYANDFGISADRLVFAPRRSVEAYLAQYQQADLFLDTLPYNAGTTASDALWMGLPVLTLKGRSFASRMAASLLTACDLPELITNSQLEYEALAVDLAKNHLVLQQIRHRLQDNKKTCRLFDTELFTRNIERAYIEVLENYRAGHPPTHLTMG